MSVCAGLSREQSNQLYIEVLESNDFEALRKLCREDLFFLLTVGMKRKDMDHDWLYARCREVEANPNGHLDLWAREHYKSTIITFGKSIQDILVNPEVTIGIFSHTRPNAKGFLDQIKREFEQNTFLKSLFSDILYESPQTQAAKWSLDNGIIVKRKSNPKEATVEAWGIVDGQPTGKHFSLMVYDDVVTKESVTTPEQIKKVTSSWELSTNLGAEGGRVRYIGTRYHANDTYRTMMDRGSVKPRIHAATDNGKMDGSPVFLSLEALQRKRRDQGPYTFGTQMLQDPVADKSMGFKEEWLKFYDKLGDTKAWNKYIVVDPASKRKSTSDYTSMWVIGLAPDGNYYAIDMVRDRLNLTQRCKRLMDLHREHMPTAVGYEHYGMQSDIEHIKYVQEQENYRFNIIELGGSLAKEDRIQTLVPLFEQARMWLPKAHSSVNYEGRRVDLVRAFIDDEFVAFPVAVHDDMLDCLARIIDPKLDAKFPKPKPREAEEEYMGMGGSGWMG